MGRFTPQTFQQMESANIIPDGEYQFKVMGEGSFGGTIETTFEYEKPSPKDPNVNNTIYRLVLAIYKRDNEFSLIKDYLTPAFPPKWKSACVACGLGEKYNTGEIIYSDFIGSIGKLVIKQEDYIDRNTGDTKKRATVERYIIPEGYNEASGTIKKANSSSGEPINDEIPF